MARRTMTYTVESEGRDAGKAFFITEMPASQAERWAIRALMAMASSGSDVPESAFNQGMAGVAEMAPHAIRALSSVPFDVAEPLLEEMMGCVQIMPNPDKPSIKRGDIAGDIEEVRTYFELRKAVFLLHVGFYEADGTSTTAPQSA